MCNSESPIQGLHWYANGQSALSGALLWLERYLDARFVEIASRSGALEFDVPIFLEAEDLDKIDYLRSFPHLATFPANLESSEDNLNAFVAGHVAGHEVRLTRTLPTRNVMTPSACYHFYKIFAGSDFDCPVHLTTKAHCFRHEAYFAPLQRQWSFSMREIVCLGTADEVQAFLDAQQKHIDTLLAELDLVIVWQQATDPFFNPTRSQKYLMQKISPSKKEGIFDDRLALCSLNFHYGYFGEAFQINRDGEESNSGCVAFGVERWIHAFLDRHGHDPRHWPVAP